MPEPPSVNPLVTYLFDTPWPLAVLLVVIGVGLLVAARSRADRRLAIGSFVAIVGAVAVFVVERMVTTSGEHAQRIAQELVEAAVAHDVARAESLFTPNATMSLVDPRNPGVGMDTIRSRLQSLEGRYRIEDNEITQLDGYSADADRGVVHLRVVTDFGGAFGYSTPSAWVIEVSRTGDDSWKITQLTFVEYNLGQRPGSNLF